MADSHDQNIVYEDGTRIVYRASSFGSCDKALILARLGHEPSPPPAKLQTTFTAGHDAEEWVTDQTRYPVIRAQEYVRLDIPNTNISIAGHIDGIPDDDSGRVVLAEIKSQSPDLYDKWSDEAWTTDPLWKKYAWQVSVYMHALGAAGLELVRVRRGEDDDGRRFTVRTYLQPFHTLDEIIDRVMKLEAQAAGHTIPACHLNTYGCPYWTMHEDPVDWVDDDELDEICRELNEAKAERKTADDRESDAKARLKKVMGRYPEKVDGDKTTRQVATGRYQVKVSTYPRREKVIPAGVETRVTVTETKGRVTAE